MLYQPNFSALRGAINHALYVRKKTNRQWRVIAIGQSQSTSSMYVYVVRHGRLAYLRFADHDSPKGSRYRVSFRVPHPDNSRELYNCLDRENNIQDKLGNCSVALDLPLLLIAKAIDRTAHDKQTFLRHYGRLYVTHPQREITDETVCGDVEKLLDLGLVLSNADGSLHTGHNCQTILKKYSSYAKEQWPKTLAGKTCNELLTELGHQLGDEVTQESLSERLTPPATNKVTPKIWRDWGQTIAENHDWFPYELLQVISPARRRSLYFYLYSPREARLALLRIGVVKTERTQVDELPCKVTNTFVVPDHRLKWVKKVITQTSFEDLTGPNFDGLQLHLLHFIWLRMVDWAGHHHSKVKLTENNVVIIKRTHDGHLKFVYCLPGNQKHWLEDLQKANLVKLTNNPRMTPLGRLVFDQYEKTRPYQNTDWEKQMLHGPQRKALFHMVDSNHWQHR